ncbi:MAG: hypothetical protein IPJ88_07800 [Myxococcales bacterium]|nr:MAG: hypothetical protein IPJ88_07800 [Myxococcales bacterium]
MDTSVLFGSQVTSMIIEVDYQQGAEPYTVNVGGEGSPWSLMALNFTKLFEARPRPITIPTTIEDMQNIGQAEDPDFTVDDVIKLAKTHRDHISSKEVPSFYILFLDGYFFENNERQHGVLGISIGGTGMVAMFKPVIQSTAPQLNNTTVDDLVRHFGEQTTLVHELGHAIGLVNNGLALTTAHWDEENGRHCSNERCVMYYLNEGARDLLEFVQDLNLCLDGAETAQEEDDCLVLFGGACLGDANYAATLGAE